MLETYREITFRQASLDQIGQAQTIIEDYRRRGLKLNLRQLYYRMVARNWIANTERSYKNLGNLISNGRLGGLISWAAIEDRTRGVEANSHWTSPAAMMDAAVQWYAIDKWLNQPRAVEVWVEKEALAGVVEPICNRLDIPWLACRGYTSQSEMWEGGRRLRRYLSSGRSPVILYLGDHDPSGIDMTRDVTERLRMFVGEPVEVVRLALNMDQVEQYGPPPNPTKWKDSRADWYMDRYGKSSWELDALDPDVIAGLIRDAVLDIRDPGLWREAEDRETEERGVLEAARDAMQDSAD